MRPAGRIDGMPQRYLDGLESRAAERLPEPVARYLRQGARHGVSAGEATAAWEEYRFLPRVLRDVTSVETRTTLLGAGVATPLGVAPTTMQRAADPDGEVAMARAAAATGTLMVLSSNAGSSFADIAATGVQWWLQMYVTADRRTTEPLLQHAVEAGADAVVLTVDSPVVGTKYDGPGPTVWEVAEPGWLRANFPLEYGDAAGDAKATDLGPEDVAWLAAQTGLPVVVKGVLRPDDARRCVQAGARAVWVSNHGGRQLDGAAATAHCLAAVADAVGEDAEVYVDGGVRDARHALAALGLGARAVFLGRLPVYALAVDGESGVRRLLEELRDDLADGLRLAGCTSPADVPRDLVVRPAVRPVAGVTGATPLSI
jgi:4-hydroxymandelate oxidase